MKSFSRERKVFYAKAAAATHTEIVCHYKIIQITFCHDLCEGLAVVKFRRKRSFFTFSTLGWEEGNKSCDFDDEWRRCLDDVKSTYERFLLCTERKTFPLENSYCQKETINWFKWIWVMASHFVRNHRRSS